MISELLSFIVLGFSLSVPVGAITIEMVKRGLRGGFLPAWFVGMGGMSADVVLMLLIYFGLAGLLTAPAAQIGIWLFGFGILVYLGIGSIREAFQQKKIDDSEKNVRPPLLKSFLAGFAIAISNPLNIVFWIGIYGSVLATSLQTMSGGQVLLYSCAIFVGIAVWDLVIAGSVHWGKERAGERFMKWFSVAAGCALIGFGLWFGWQAFAGIFR